MKKLIAAVLTLTLMLACACWAEEEIYPECSFDLDGYGGTLLFTYADGGLEETGGWGFGTEITKEGMTIGDVLAGFDIVDVEAFYEDDVFEGWLVFDVSVTTDEYGFDEYSYVLNDAAPITTEDLLALPLTEAPAMYAAKWAGIPAEDYFNYEDEAESYEITLASATLFAGGGVITTRGEEKDYEIGLSVSSIEPGQLLGEALELDRLLRISREGYDFSGWTMYEIGWMETFDEKPAEDGNPCFKLADDWYCVLYEASIIGEDMDTLAIGEYVCGESELFICATWE